VIIMTKQAELHRWGVEAFNLVQNEMPEERSDFVARTVGAHAQRLGFTEQELSRWIQSEYSALWVKHSALNPGLDMKDVRKIVLFAFNRDRSHG
jgi:hypothetical protein